VTLRAGPGDDHAERGAEIVRERTDLVPRVAVVTGSGLGAALAEVKPEAEIAYAELPGLVAPTVPGHAGRLVVGTFAGVPVLVLFGRQHFYEGHPMSVVSLPVRLAAALGAEALVATASVGGLDPALEPGQLVVGEDHINMMGGDPLLGWRARDGAAVFVDPSAGYVPAWQDLAVAAAGEAGLPVSRGVYLAVSGPSYETRAEAEHMRRAGGTVVGMSVVPEVVAAAALEMRGLGLYCVTNMVGPGTNHEEVTAVAAGFAPKLAEVLRRVLPAIGEELASV